jgi:hypothetical protein
MRPVDDMYCATPPLSSAKPRASSLASRSPSPGNRSTMGSSFGGTGTSTGGGMTYFLTEENNFGVHSLSESTLAHPTASSSTTTASTDAEVIDKPSVHGSASASRDPSLPRSEEADSHSKGTDKASSIPAAPPRLPSHSHTASLGSNVSPTVSTPSSPQHNLSSSAVSDDSELDLSSHHEEEESLNRSFPQLVMPRVTMPRRKAFTETGKNMGRLKVMVVGDSGTILEDKTNKASVNQA